MNHTVSTAASHVNANVFVDAEMVSLFRNKFTDARLSRNDTGGLTTTQYHEDAPFGPRIECRDQRFGRWETAYIVFATEEGMAKWKAEQLQILADTSAIFENL